MSHPNVTFRKSVKKDLETLRAFTKDSAYDDGRNLHWAIFDKFPELKKYFDIGKRHKIKNEKALRDFINKTYLMEQTEMDRALERHGNRWNKIAPHFFSLVDTLFKGREWPGGRYIAFGTIWNMYPRFLEDKTFQIPFRHRRPSYISVVIAHELLHFMFYDYFFDRYPKFNHSKYNFLVWHISEIFNTLIQNSPDWLRHFKVKSIGYPEHEKIVTRISRNFYRRSTPDIDVLVEEIIKEVRNQKIVH